MHVWGWVIVNESSMCCQFLQWTFPKQIFILKTHFADAPKSKPLGKFSSALSDVTPACFSRTICITLLFIQFLSYIKMTVVCTQKTMTLLDYQVSVHFPFSRMSSSFFFTWQIHSPCHISYCQRQVSRFSAVDRQYTRLMDTSLPFPPDTPPLPCPLPCPVKLTQLDCLMAGEQELYWCLRLSPWPGWHRYFFHVANPTPTGWSFLSHSVSGIADCFLAFSSSAQEYPTIHCRFS